MVLPEILAGMMRATSWLAQGSTAYLVAIRLFLCLLSLTTIYTAFKTGERLFDRRVGLLCGGLCAFWYELIYFSPRALAEVVAAHIFIVAIYLVVFAVDALPSITDSRSWPSLGSRLANTSLSRYFLAGLLASTALMLRLQLAPAVGVLVLYSCGKDWRDKWLPMIAGAIPPVLVFGAVDWITWSYPFQSIFLNFDINLLQHKAAQFGTEPFGFYARRWLTYLGPMVLFSAIGAITVKRARVLGYLALAVVVPHSMLAHKEPRYIYPALPLMLILAGLGIWQSARWLSQKTRWKSQWQPAILLLVLAGGITSAFDVPKMHWNNRTGVYRAMQQLSHTPDACGVALYGVDWSNSGGYTYLHRNVPIFVTSVEFPYAPISPSAANTIGNWMNFDAMSPSFNYVVAETPLPASLHGYSPIRCWQEACLYKRPGTCSPTPGYSTSELLRLMNK